jgi:hypothetical protein
MKVAVISVVGGVLVSGLGLRWFLAHQGIGADQLMLIDGAVVAVALAALALGLERIIQPYETIRRRVAESVRARTPRSVNVEGFAPQRELARQIDTLMRLLEERMEDPNLGPVYLHGGERAGERADSFVEDQSATNETQGPGDISRPEVAAHTDPEGSIREADPILDSVAPHEPFRELFVSYIQALRAADRHDEISDYGGFIDALDEVRQQLLTDHPGYDVLFFLEEGPQIKPRLVPSQVPESGS